MGRSTNGGLTFTKNPALEEAYTLDIGKAGPGNPYPTLFVFGMINKQTGVYFYWRRISLHSLSGRHQHQIGLRHRWHR
jgi:hypothetical protein